MSLVRESVPLAPPWLPLWGSCHEVTERVKNALSAPLGHLSHRERQVALIRLALAGDARATFTLWSYCHRQLLDFNSLRGAPPLVSKGSLCALSIVRGIFWGLPHQCEHWFAMTYGFRFYSIKIERYRAVPNSLINTDQLAHALPAGAPGR